ncbi:MAG: hypothetical protein ACHQ17_02870, partial [Polyangia bacterium]
MSLRRASFLLLACFLVLGVRDSYAKSGGGGSGGGGGGSGGGTSTGGGSKTAVSGPLTSFSAGAIVIPMDDCYNPDYTANSAPMASTAGCVASAGQTCYAGTTS